MSGTGILALVAAILGPGGAIASYLALLAHRNGPQHKPAAARHTSPEPDERPRGR